MSKKEWPFLYIKLLYKMGHYFLDTQYYIKWRLKHDFGGIVHWFPTVGGDKKFLAQIGQDFLDIVLYVKEVVTPFM